MVDPPNHLLLTFMQYSIVSFWSQSFQIVISQTQINFEINRLVQTIPGKSKVTLPPPL